MKFFPKVTSPCPYKGALAEIMEGDTCRLCKKAVHDITDWSEDAKQALMADCSDEVCVTYRFDARPAMAAVAASAAVMAPTALAAQEATQEQADTAAEQAYDEDLYWDQQVIFVGGVRKDKAVAWQDEAKARKGRELPVEYEDAKSETAKKDTGRG